MIDPPFLLPSEIARLVYGHLKDLNCPVVAEKFLTTSPDMAECLENVKKKGKADFMTKAFSLSLDEILESYLNISSTILDQINKAIPDRSQKFSDPIAALKTLLSMDEQSSNKIDKCDRFVDKTSIPNTYITNGVSSSNICLQVELSPEKIADKIDEQNDPNKICDTNSMSTEENLDDDNGSEFGNNFFHKQNSRTRLLDELYASTEDLVTGPKKRIKFLKPRQTYFDRSEKLPAMGKSLANEDGKNNENITSDENNKSEIIAIDDKSDNSIFVSPQTPNTSSMRLRSCKQAASETPVRTETDNKATKSQRKSKSSQSSEKRSTTSNSAKECDAQVDFTQIPKMFMDNPKWPELIAENINKRISESPRKRIDTSAEEQNSVFESIAEKTLESDDLCEEIIRGLYACCSENAAQSPPSLDNDIIFPVLCEENQCENGAATNQLSQNQHLTNPSQFNGNYNDEISGTLHNTRLQDDMSEFINFNKQQSNETQSNVIVIEMSQSEQNTPASGDYIIKSHGHLLQSNSIMYVDNENEIQDEIINLCPEEGKNVEWNVQSTAVVSTTANPISFDVGTNNAKNKFQIRGPIIPIGQTFTMDNNGYRAIAPKPVSSEPVSEVVENKTTDNQRSADEPGKTRSRSTLRKVSGTKISTRRSKR